MKFNINDTVLIRLNDYGRLLLRADHVKFMRQLGRDHPYVPPKEDEHGFSKWQLWSLMQHFGPYVSIGSEAPFDTEIIIPDEGRR